MDAGVFFGAVREGGEGFVAGGVERGLLRGEKADEHEMRGGGDGGFGGGRAGGFAGDEVALVGLGDAVDGVVDRGVGGWRGRARLGAAGSGRS